MLVKNADGNVAEGNKRDILWRHVISKVITGGSEMIGTVDCGVYEEGVEGLDAELQTIVNGFNDPKPDIQVYKFKSYLFIHTSSVVIENVEWRCLFTPARLDADEKQLMLQLGQRLSDKAIANHRNRRVWRGCLIIDANIATGRLIDGVVVIGGAASSVGQTRDV